MIHPQIFIGAKPSVDIVLDPLPAIAVAETAKDTIRVRSSQLKDNLQWLLALLPYCRLAWVSKGAKHHGASAVDAGVRVIHVWCQTSCASTSRLEPDTITRTSASSLAPGDDIVEAGDNKRITVLVFIGEAAVAEPGSAIFKFGGEMHALDQRTFEVRLGLVSRTVHHAITILYVSAVVDTELVWVLGQISHPSHCLGVPLTVIVYDTLRRIKAKEFALTVDLGLDIGRDVADHREYLATIDGPPSQRIADMPVDVTQPKNAYRI